MTNTIPHDHHHHHQHHQEMDRLQALLAVKPQAKKQSRRRTHTSRPYQQRLLNMAEARREIVTALKIHRATTTTTTTRQHHQHQQSTYQNHHHHEPPPLRQPPPQQQLHQQQEEEQLVQAVAFRNRSRSQAAAVDEEAPLSSHTTAMTSYAAASFCNLPLCNSHWIAAGGSYCSPPGVPCDLTPPELAPTAAMGGGLVELEHDYQYQGGLERLIHSLSLPAQPLGLNLSFHGFGVSVDDGAAAMDDREEDLFGSLPLVAQPSPPAAASYSYSPPAPAVEATATITTHAYGHGQPKLSAAAAAAEEDPLQVAIDAPAPALIPVPDDGGETMAQATAGVMQSVEWSEAAAAAADVAAWWSKIFEGGQRAPSSSPNAEDVALAATAAGLPAEWRWLCGDDVVGGAAEQGAGTGDDVLATMVHVGDDGGHSDDCEDVILPCMEGIGDDDAQGWDGEWFSCS